MNFSLGGAAAVATREDAGCDVALNDEFGEPLKNGEEPVIARVAGNLSSIFKKADQAVADKAAKRRAQITGDTFDNQRAEITASCVLSWNLQDDGKPIPCDKTNVLTVFKVAPWIRRDIEAAMADPARFLR